MTHISTVPRESLPELEPLLQAVEAGMGFVPNSMLTMAHWPELLQSFAGFAGTILNSGEVDPGLKQLIAFVSSHASGCRYCQAHTSHNATRRGIDEAKVAAAFEFEASDLFTEAERAALRVALYGGTVPNGVEKAHMDALSEHFSERQIVEIMSVIALFGFLNRWNDTMATTLEDEPAAFANNTLKPKGWAPGKHEHEKEQSQ